MHSTPHIPPSPPPSLPACSAANTEAVYDSLADILPQDRYYASLILPPSSLPPSLSSSATNTEAVHDSLADFLPQDRYYRFNPNIENMSIDEVEREAGREGGRDENGMTGGNAWFCICF